MKMATCSASCGLRVENARCMWNSLKQWLARNSIRFEARILDYGALYYQTCFILGLSAQRLTPQPSLAPIHRYSSPGRPRCARWSASANASRSPATPLLSEEAGKWYLPVYSMRCSGREHPPSGTARAQSRRADTRGRHGDGTGPRDWDKSANPGKWKQAPKVCYTNFHSPLDRKSTRLNSSHRCISYA